jgi:DNA-binding transcriptional LysR family regulator
MEKLLGAELLTRTTHSLALTPIGAEVLARTDFLVNTVDMALRDIESTVRRGRAFVRIGVIPSASGAVAGSVSEFLREGGRELELAWRDAPSTTLLAEVRSGQLDFAVAAITEAPGGGLASVELFRDPLVLVLRRDHALAGLREVGWEAVGGERLVLFESGSMPALGNPARAQFAQGAEPYRVSYSETLYALVRGGLALGLMPRLYTASLRDPQLVVLPLARPRIERRVVLVYPAGPTRNEVARELIAFLRRRLPLAPGGPVKTSASAGRRTGRRKAAG